VKLHSVTATQCDSYTVWQLNSLKLNIVTATQCDNTQCVRHTVPLTAICSRRNELTGWVKDKYHLELFKPTEYFFAVFCFKNKLSMTPLKSHKKFVVYITRHSELHVENFFTRYNCCSLILPYIDMSILLCTYPLVRRIVSECVVAFERLNIW